MGAAGCFALIQAAAWLELLVGADEPLHQVKPVDILQRPALVGLLLPAVDLPQDLHVVPVVGIALFPALYGMVPVLETWIARGEDGEGSALAAGSEDGMGGALVGGFTTLGTRKAVLGVIHLQPLPGTPFHQEGAFEQIRDTAVASACALEEGGADGCLVQTVDRVYGAADVCDPARTAATSLIVAAIVAATSESFQIGVQIMRNALTASLAVAKVAGGSFIRAGALVGATLTASGVVVADPLAVAEYRNKIGAQAIKVIAEVDSMHFKWFGGGKSAGEVARLAQGAGADAVSVGHPDEGVTLEMIASVRAAVPGLPVILAGYTDHGNAARLLAAADGAFVGRCLEAGGWGGPVDAGRVRAYVEIVRGLAE